MEKGGRREMGRGREREWKMEGGEGKIKGERCLYFPLFHLVHFATWSKICNKVQVQIFSPQDFLVRIFWTPTYTVHTRDLRYKMFFI